MVAHNMIAYFSQSERSKKRETKMEAIIFYNLISEATEHHFCYILQVILTNPGKMREVVTQACKYQ